MKKKQAKKVLDDQIKKFASEIANILFDSMFILKSFKFAKVQLENEVDNFQELFDKIERKTGTQPYDMMWTAVPIIDVTQDSPKSYPIGGKSLKHNQLLQVLVENLNQQHLWLIVQAYEAFERFNKDLFGCLGYLDSNIWLTSNDIKFEISEFKYKRLDWYKIQVRNTIGNRDIKKIMKKYRKVFPDYSKYEVREPDILKLWIGFHELLRHTIVHTQSSIPDLELIKRLKRFTGLAFPCKNKLLINHQAHMMTFFTKKDDIYRINAINSSSLDRTNNTINFPTRYLIEKLASHAYLTYKSAISYFGHDPIVK